ncbi:MAG: DUF1460 domain-containing protein [Bdellovibrionales bacterium]|nr:DUF1460 domain-containing protein [Bdellovibrionales bacterium]
MVISGKHIPEMDISKNDLKNLLNSISKFDKLEDKLEFVSSHFLNLPYLANSLIGSSSEPEQFVISFKSFDCVTYIETIFALVLSHDLNQFFENLRKLRYQAGNISWESRNHYMIDWIERNVAQNFCKTVNFLEPTIEIKRQLSIIKDYPIKSKTIDFIPYEQIFSNPNSVNGQLICFGTTRENLDVSHCGLLFKKQDLVLRHASRDKQVTLEEPLSEFLARFGESPGALICELSSNKT